MNAPHTAAYVRRMLDQHMAHASIEEHNDGRTTYVLAGHHTLTPDQAHELAETTRIPARMWQAPGDLYAADTAPLSRRGR